MSGSIYEVVGGGPALLRLANAWHQRCLADPIMSHPFRHGTHPEHIERLAAYWAEALGGPADYSASTGDGSHVLRMHAGNGEHLEMDERAQVCFVQAIDDAGLPEDTRLRTALTDYFRWATALMASYPDSPDEVPEGLPVARWSWEGPEQEHRTR